MWYILFLFTFNKFDFNKNIKEQRHDIHWYTLPRILLSYEIMSLLFIVRAV